MCDYTVEPEVPDVKVSFDGERLEEWLETEGEERALGEDGKPKGVRWSGLAGDSSRAGLTRQSMWRV